jgi:hypothetical protein
MADLTFAGFFTRNVGQPATGLTLADIDFYLTEQDRATGNDTVIWDGSQHPTEEIDNIGAYIRIYTGADLNANNYFGRATYTGAAVLDVDDVMGGLGLLNIPIGTAIDFTYTVTDVGTGLPIQGVHIEITTDIGGVNVVWCGETDSFGVARDDNGELPRLDPGTWYFWRNKPGYIFTNPDTEVVS